MCNITSESGDVGQVVNIATSASFYHEASVRQRCILTLSYGYKR